MLKELKYNVHIFPTLIRGFLLTHEYIKLYIYVSLDLIWKCHSVAGLGSGGVECRIRAPFY